MKNKEPIISKYIEQEYPQLENHILEGDAKFSFSIPSNIILNTNMTQRRITLFAYLFMHAGLNNHMVFSLNHFLEWAGLGKDSHEKGNNEKVKIDLRELCQLKYIRHLDTVQANKKNCFEIIVDKQALNEVNRCGRFGIVYWDEVLTIMQYKNENTKDRYFNAHTILLVFAYLRQQIRRRTNILKPEERTDIGAQDRKIRLPEAYNGTYKNMAKDLGISKTSFSKAVEALIQMQLIVVAEPWRLKKDDGSFWTPDMIFVNTYKRDNGFYLTGGAEYYQEEIKNKEKMMQAKYYERYSVKNILVA